MTRWIAICFLVFVGCATDVTEYYPPEQVEVRHVSFDHEGRLSLDYRAAAETLWACPGADVERDGETLVFRFERVWFRDAGTPEADAVRIGEVDHVEVTSVGDIRRIVVADARGRAREVWRNGRFVGD